MTLARLRRLLLPETLEPRSVFIASILAMAAVFALDLSTPADVRLHVLYIFPLAAIALRCDRIAMVVAGFALATAFQTLTFFYHHIPSVPLITDISVAVASSVVTTLLGMFARKRGEALRDSYETLNSIVETTLDGYWRHDTRGRLLDVNRAYSRLSDYAREELLGMRSAELMLKADAVTYATHLRRVIETGRGQFEATHLRKDGSTWVAEMSATYRRVAGGQLLIFVRDITERKRAEAARLALEAQLRETQKMEALGTLAGGVAHDFNNALATIIGNVELARQDLGPDHAALVSLDEIDKASRRTKDLVQQILAFSKRQTLERKPTSLAQVVVESEGLLRAILPHDVGLHVDCRPAAPAVLADAAQITQILLNLCDNAVHAVQNQGRPGSIEVQVYPYEQAAGESRGDLRPGRYACLLVRDNGAGMDEATRLRVFEPFFTTKRVGEGSGLGLAAVHGIVQAHEARIEVKSAPGAGSEFCMFFPAAAAAEDGPRAAAAPAPRIGGDVLYVDDDESIVFLMQRLLQRRGYRVRGYTDARQALAAVRARPDRFALAVTDYNMPLMSGLEFAHALKQIRSDLPLVLASGYISDELRAQAPAAGIRELIYKPNTVDDLCEAVARLAAAHRADDRSAAVAAPAPASC